MLKKLRIKFVVINMSIVVAMLLVIFGLVYHFTASNLEEQSIAMAQTAAQSALQPGVPEEIRLPYFTLRISMTGMVTAQGVTGFDLTDENALRELLNTVYDREQTSGIIEQYSLRYYKTSGPGEQCVGFVDISSHSATLGALIQISVAIGLVSIVAFLGISFLLARWAVKPVETAWEQQKQFVSDASHELKTPLTVIMSNAELLQNQDCDTEHQAQFTENILTMSHRMRKLVESLLELARADNGQVKKSFAPVDLSELVRDAVLPYEPVFFERGLFLQSQVEQDLRVNGSAQYLGQVVDILLDNAGKYASPGVVSVRLQRQGRSCLLSVSNPGEPIPREALSRIFERFYREDKARTGTGSFGLGLSIAKSVVEEHGGRIWAESNESGNCFFVQLPLQ